MLIQAILPVFFILIKCEWLEIPQSTSNYKNKANENFLFEKSDFIQSVLGSSKNILLKYQQDNFTTATNKPFDKYDTQEISLNNIKKIGKPKIMTISSYSDEIPIEKFDTKNVLLSTTERTFEQSFASERKTSLKQFTSSMDEDKPEVTISIAESEPINSPEEIFTTIEKPSFNSFFEFLKTIQKTLVSKAYNGIKDKVESLKKLRDVLLVSIEDRLNELWPKNPARNKRTIKDHGIQFGSGEIALLSINFLTFALFLIKLVIQVIHVVKSKHYTYNGIVTDDNAETFKLK